MTYYKDIYDVFFNKITDDMYLELTEEDTYKLLKPILHSAVEQFEFPRVNLYYRKENEEYFLNDLSYEEKNILATYMVCEWFTQQLATIDLTRLKYSSSDFKFTSQANHMSKLKTLKETFVKEGKHLQRLYKRRKMDASTGIYKSTFGEIMYKDSTIKTPSRGGSNSVVMYYGAYDGPELDRLEALKYYAGSSNEVFEIYNRNNEYCYFAVVGDLKYVMADMFKVPIVKLPYTLTSEGSSFNIYRTANALVEGNNEFNIVMED